ncbi:MAG: hypothetical protein Q9213_003770 [Squamulea squamosa]
MFEAVEDDTRDSQTDDQSHTQTISDTSTVWPRLSAAVPDQESSTVDNCVVEPTSDSDKETPWTGDQPTATAGEQQSGPAVIDFAQSNDVKNHKPETETSKRMTVCNVPTIAEEEHHDHPSFPRSSEVLEQLPSDTGNTAGHDGKRTSFKQDRRSVRNSILSVFERPSRDSDTETTDMPSRILRRLSYVAQNMGGNRASIINGARSVRQWVFRQSRDSDDMENDRGAWQKSNRNSKAIPKSWRFLGIDGPSIGDTVNNMTQKLRKSNIREMYGKAKIKQQQIKRSESGQLIFRYTFYTIIIAAGYLILVGMPLWRGAVLYLYILFQHYMVLKAGLAITFGIGFLYAFAPLLINFEPSAPLPEADESGRTEPANRDTALIIPCYKSEQLIGHTLDAALKIFPRESIFVVANGNSPDPLDNTATICEQYGVSHTWSPLGSKIIAQFVGCYVARKFPNVLLIDDDCLLPPNLPIVSDRLKGKVKCIGYIMKATGPNGSKGTLCQQAQDLEYKLSGLAKSFAGKVGSVTFPHGAIVLWDREVLVETFKKHPGFSVSEDWFFGHAARQLGCRIQMVTSTFVETEVPSSIFFSSGGARGGFGE